MSDKGEPKELKKHEPSDIEKSKEPKTEQPDPHRNLHFGPPFLEQLVVALVQGHPNETSKTDRQRVDQVLFAITGKKSSGTPFPDDPIDAACLSMAWEYHMDRITHSPKMAAPEGIGVQRSKSKKPRSVLELARKAEEKFLKSTDLGAKQSNVNRLREMFSGSYQNRSKAANIRRKIKRLEEDGKFEEAQQLIGGSPIKYKDTYVFRAMEHDDIEESLRFQTLQRIQKELAKFKVPLKLPYE